MPTYQVETLSEQVDALLHQLDEMHLLRLVPAVEAPTPPTPRKWAGSIPATSAAAWDKHLAEIRGEWERDI